MLGNQRQLVNLGRGIAWDVPTHYAIVLLPFADTLRNLRLVRVGPKRTNWGVRMGTNDPYASDGLTKGCERSLRKGRALDLFCGAGGVSVGLHRAGFEVVGVDIKDQPRYPFTFIRSDALELLDLRLLDLEDDFDFIWASPPCQHYSDLAYRNGNADSHPDLIDQVRSVLGDLGLPYVIENVEGAPLRDPVTVCGTALGLGTAPRYPEQGGYRLRRHRCFEANFELYGTACACAADQRPVIDVSGGGPTHSPRLDGKGGRTYKGTVAEKRAAMGIDWMTGAELVEAIPPAYAELIGAQVPTRERLAV